VKQPVSKQKNETFVIVEQKATWPLSHVLYDMELSYNQGCTPPKDYSLSVSGYMIKPLELGSVTCNTGQYGEICRISQQWKVALESSDTGKP
jgi:hypothetical protein